MKTLHSLIFLCLFALSIQAQDNTFVSYSYADGFYNAQLVDMAEDERGVLWFVGLTGVLYSYDGYEFARHPLPDTLFTNNIFRIAAVHGLPYIYLFTDRGILRFNGNAFDAISLDVDYSLQYSLNVVTTDHQQLWYLTTDGSVTMLTQDSVRRWIPESGKSVKWISKYRNGVLVVTNSNEILYVDDTMKSTSLKRPVLPDLLAAEHVDDHWWLVAPDGIHVIDENDSEIEHVPMKLTSIKSVKVDRNRNVWILSELKLYKFDGGAVSRVMAADGLTDNHIIQIFLDRTRTLWVNTDTDGTFRFSHKPFQRLPLPDGTIVSKMLTVDDKTFIGTFGSGLFVRDENGVISKPAAFKVFDKTLITGIVQHAQELLIGTDGQGLFAYRDGKLRSITNPGYLNLFVRTMVTSKHTYIATQGGIFIYDGTRVSPLLENIANVNAIHHLSEDSLIIGTRDKGMIIASQNAITPFDKSFFSSTAVNAIVPDAKGNLWVACNKNTLSLYSRTLDLLQRIPLPTDVGSVTSITFFGKQNVLITGDDKIYYAQLNDAYELSDFRRVKRSQGFNPGELVLGGVAKESDSLIWLSTSSGGYYFNPERLQNAAATPIVFISNVKLGSNADINTFSQGRAGISQLPVNLMLPYNENQLTIAFQGNDLQHPADIRYQYQLEGLEHSWSSVVSDRKVLFANLLPGQYTFKVRTIGAAGIVSAEDHFSFVIVPAFWQTSWFKTLMAGVLLIMLLLLARFISQQRIKRFQYLERIRLAEAQRIREQMSMDFHDELGNKLAGILAYSSTLRVTNKDAEIAGLLNYVEQSAQAIFYGTRDFIWSIKFESNLLYEVLLYIRDFGAKLFEKHHIAFHVDVDLSPIAFNAMLPDAYNRHIVMIFKEAMTNTVKHSGCSAVRFSVIRDGKKVSLIFEDDGSGLQQAPDGNGASNMRRRADNIGGLIHFDNVIPHGTRVTLTFNIE